MAQRRFLTRGSLFLTRTTVRLWSRCRWPPAPTRRRPDSARRSKMHSMLQHRTSGPASHVLLRRLRMAETNFLASSRERASPCTSRLSTILLGRRSIIRLNAPNVATCSTMQKNVKGIEKKLFIVAGGREGEVHGEDEKSGTPVNEKDSDPPTEMIEYGNKLDATPENVEADLKYEGTSLPGWSDQNYTTENTASHVFGKFDQSAEDMAAIFCCQKSIEVLRMNNADEDLYFLNVILQLLWNLMHFRNEFLRIRPFFFHTTHQDPCIAEKLYEIFSAWEKNEHSEMVLLLTDVKTTLCEIVNDSNIFQKLQVGRNFASDIMAVILEGLHKYETSMFFGSRRVVIRSPCRYRIWYAFDLFGIKLKQLMSCRCGEWFGEEYTLFLHKLDASSPHTTKINSFEELPMLMDSQSNCESRCNKCSGSVKQIDCFLSKGPHFFTIVLKDLLVGDKRQAILSEALFGIASPLDITLLYKGVTLPHIGGHSATKYRVASVICYIEHRYVCFARDQDKWLKYDTMTVKAVDSWGELLELYREMNLQPEVVIYDVIT